MDLLTNIFNDIKIHDDNELKEILYNKEVINCKSIDSFTVAEKKLNDKNNKTRENIIGAIINDNIPNEYYIINRWLMLRTRLFKILDELVAYKTYNKIICIHKGGRNNKYDFSIEFIFDDNTKDIFNVEFKFNISEIKQAPQFVSPMKPSQYMTNSYEEYYYDNYLSKLSELSGFILPKKEDYLKEIHNINPKCMMSYQELYYQGCKTSSKFNNNEKAISFYKYSIKISKESISNFINKTDIKIELLSDYLYTTQKNKIYLFYHNGQFILQKKDIDDYKINIMNKNPNKSCYECISKNGYRIKILLRWKNGNGIAFPAFQIS